MIGEIRQNFTEASASVGLIQATALIPFLFHLHLDLAYITSFGSCVPIKDIFLRPVSC